MIKRLISTSLALFCLFAFLAALSGIGCGPSNGPQGNGGATNTPGSLTKTVTPVDCTYATHDDIIKAIYAEIEKFPSYSKQEWQFNITHVDGPPPKITIVGWSVNKVNIEKIVRDTAQNCTLETTYFLNAPHAMGSNYRVSTQCNQGYTQCGDVCIPTGDYCRIRGVQTIANSASVTNTTTGANSNSTSSSNSGSNSNAGTKAEKAP